MAILNHYFKLDPKTKLNGMDKENPNEKFNQDDDICATIWHWKWPLSKNLASCVHDLESCGLKTIEEVYMSNE